MGFGEKTMSFFLFTDDILKTHYHLHYSINNISKHFSKCHKTFLAMPSCLCLYVE